ncbi:MAG: acyl-CoA reductase [Chitinophagales bacterium]|nr:acyl-CoA reductase [Bacteroidota bacterium]
MSQTIWTAYQANKWFTPANIEFAFSAIAQRFLQENLLEQWVENYPFLYQTETYSPKKIALIMAGNIPLAGFHDWLCVLLSGNIALVKSSSKDAVLLKHLANYLGKIAPELADKTIFVEGKLPDFDAIIATGSNNTNRYFQYYFGKYPHILRNNRNSLAVLPADMSNRAWQQLGIDIFTYFGLGCRNVAKLLLPPNISPAVALENLQDFHSVKDHDKYKNNYDYLLSILLLNNVPHWANDFLILQESSQLASPIASLHFEYYQNEDDLQEKLAAHSAQTQCIVGAHEAYTHFGEAQLPTLAQYADNIDTMAFLGQLK